jgi:hypothetical protein
MSNFEHIISQITESEKRVEKQLKLQETLEIHQRFTTLEQYSIPELLILHAYLSDLSLDHKLIPGKDELFLPKEKSTLSGRIHTRLKVLERILNLPDEVPSTVVGSHLILINAYGYRSKHCKGRMYGYRNTMTLISRQCRYYLFKNLYFDIDLKNAHPTMLLSYAEKNNLEVHVLKEYIDNREKFLQKVMEFDGITRNDAKVAILRCLNLVSDNSLPNYLKSLHKDILIIREHLYENNILNKTTILGEYAMSRDSYKSKNVERQKVSLQAQYCATEESKSLMVLYEVCIQKGLLDKEVTLNKKVRNISFIPFFDGAYVKFDGLNNVSEVEQIIKDTNELVYPYSFELKDIEPDWDYLKEDVLKKYEYMHYLLGILTEKDYHNLLKILDMKPFLLDTNILDDIRDHAMKCSPNNTNSKAEQEFYFGWMDGNNKYLTEVIENTTRQYKYDLRKRILEFAEKNSFHELEIQLGIIKR